jgi:hypothetical protein
MKTENKRLVAMLACSAFLLLIPFVGGLLSGNMKWSAFDFAVAGAFFFGTVTAVELVLRLVRRTTYRLAIGGAVLLALFVVWVEIAVGVFGTRFAGS